MSGESGGTSRLNVDEVNSQCDLVAEREAMISHSVSVMTKKRTVVIGFGKLYSLACKVILEYKIYKISRAATLRVGAIIVIVFVIS